MSERRQPQSGIHPVRQRLFICGSDECTPYQYRQISHLLKVGNPGAPLAKPTWFNGQYLELRFGDVTSEADARRCQSQVAAQEQIRQAMEFFRSASGVSESRMLVTCEYGASRSPALAYLFIADELGPGFESEALHLMLQIRPEAVPNAWVVHLGDAFLQRHGALLEPLKKFHSRLNAELAEGSADRP